MSQTPEAAPGPSGPVGPGRPEGTDDSADTQATGGVPSPTRLIVGVVLGAAVATVGGFILGEYPFTGLTPYFAGVLFALVVAEVILSVSRQHDRRTAVAAAVCTLGGLGLAVWISSGDGIDPIPIGGWMALAVGLVAALARGGITGVGRRGRSSLPS